MIKKSKQETILTASGLEVDKDLMRVPIKVSPSLQALIANQIDLLDMLDGKLPPDPIFIEQHRVEVSQVEEEVASGFSVYMQKKEKARERRRLKKKALEEAKEKEKEFTSSAENGMVHFPESQAEESYLPWESPVSEVKHDGADKGFTASNGDTVSDWQADSFTVMPGEVSSGLPSAKYTPRSKPAVKEPDIDVRRVAVGASIKALRNFLGRDLTEDEIQVLETQVDSYLA